MFNLSTRTHALNCLAFDSNVEGELRHIGVVSSERLFDWLVGAIKEVWVHIISL